MVAHAAKQPNMDRIRALVDVVAAIETITEIAELRGDKDKATELRKIGEEMRAKFKGRAVQGVTTAMILEAMRKQEGAGLG